VSHGQNFTSQQYNSHAISQIKEDMQNFSFGSTQVTRFSRIFQDQAKLLAIMVNKTPLLLFTRHPAPTDDIVPEVGEIINQYTNSANYQDPMIVDCHNAIGGDEILIKKESKEAQEMLQITQNFFEYLGKENLTTYSDVLYAVAKDPVKEFPISAGIGAGGIIVHLFKIGNQETAIIHIDANNAYTPVRSALMTLGENMGLDRIELCTSDTHAVVRILSSQGYYPLGTKISADFLTEKIRTLITKARSSFSQIEIATYTSISPGYRFWKDLSYFDIIIETIERCLIVSKVLLTIGLLLPTLISLVIMLFYY
jgi:predicted neutral ceramidase superfamily lipid hydrolase